MIGFSRVVFSTLLVSFLVAPTPIHASTPSIEYELPTLRPGATNQPSSQPSFDTNAPPTPPLQTVNLYSYLCLQHPYNDLCLGISPGNTDPVYDPNNLFHLQLKSKLKNEARKLDYRKTRWAVHLLQGQIYLSNFTNLCISRDVIGSQEVVLRPCIHSNQKLWEWNLTSFLNPQEVGMIMGPGTLSDMCLAVQKCVLLKGKNPLAPQDKHCDPTVTIPLPVGEKPVPGAFVKLTKCNQVLNPIADSFTQFTDCAFGCTYDMEHDTSTPPKYCSVCGVPECGFQENLCKTRAPTPPTPKPTPIPSRHPTLRPTKKPSTAFPSRRPSFLPSRHPSRTPTTLRPTDSPSRRPTTSTPTHRPSYAPISSVPSLTPSLTPSTSFPSYHPSRQPTGLPSREPSRGPSRSPSGSPSPRPSKRPTQHPSHSPSLAPSQSPTVNVTNATVLRSTAPPPHQDLLALWIILGILGCCCLMFCCCGPELVKREDEKKKESPPPSTERPEQQSPPDMVIEVDDVPPPTMPKPPPEEPIRKRRDRENDDDIEALQDVPVEKKPATAGNVTVMDDDYDPFADDDEPPSPPPPPPPPPVSQPDLPKRPPRVTAPPTVAPPPPPPPSITPASPPPPPETAVSAADAARAAFAQAMDPSKSGRYRPVGAEPSLFWGGSQRKMAPVAEAAAGAAVGGAAAGSEARDDRSIMRRTSERFTDEVLPNALAEQQKRKSGIPVTIQEVATAPPPLTPIGTLQHPQPPSSSSTSPAVDVDKMSVKELKSFIQARGGDPSSALEKSDLQRKARSYLFDDL